MTRLENWPTLLSLYVDSRRNEPFAWGSNDCCLFAADWVLIATGIDIAASYRGTYTGALGAQRIIFESGGIDRLLEANAPMLSRISPKFVSRGDLVLSKAENGPTLGINLGAINAFVGERGLLFAPLDEQGIYWRL